MIHSCVQPRDASIESGRRRQQAQHEIGLALEVEEEARMHEHVVVGQKLQHQRLLDDPAEIVGLEATPEWIGTETIAIPL